VRTSDLDSGLWEPLGRTMSGNDGILQVAIDGERSNTFYRVRALP
jgi:hypothetical protein